MSREQTVELVTLCHLLNIFATNYYLRADFESEGELINPQLTITSSTKIHEGEPAALCQAGAVDMFWATTFM